MGEIGWVKLDTGVPVGVEAGVTRKVVGRLVDVVIPASGNWQATLARSKNIMIASRGFILCTGMLVSLSYWVSKMFSTCSKRNNGHRK